MVNVNAITVQDEEVTCDECGDESLEVITCELCDKVQPADCAYEDENVRLCDWCRVDGDAPYRRHSKRATR